MAESGFDIALDELVLAGARRGDLDACEKIYRKYQRPAFNTAIRICRCPEMANDICQEAFITVFRKIRQFRGDAPFWGWLRRVVVNHAISAIRRQPSAEHIEFEDYQASDSGQQEQMGVAMDLESALDQLSSTDRAIVWLHDVEGYRHREIAGLFSKTESFSKTRLARARARLREVMALAEKSQNICAS
ncbi:MAG: sigma-70 family RNA polymerase sigma factor [Xanthomonadales bacterium]|nr:sigma-70 family RNA polymerase sigma factor [Gammaproteobacteria bacterium]NNE04464.1 sigma-70 family RNA polymerase sigma factor [Xanthomonadales bacterium]NNL94124.1 sigma-70 family RNA polymerase sigma factor [Xanthomonadales bacterium]